MNHRKLKKAARWLMRRFDSIGGRLEEERATELVCEAGSVESAYGYDPRVTPHRAAQTVWEEELSDWEREQQ